MKVFQSIWLAVISISLLLIVGMHSFDTLPSIGAGLSLVLAMVAIAATVTAYQYDTNGGLGGNYARVDKDKLCSAGCLLVASLGLGFMSLFYHLLLHD